MQLTGWRGFVWMVVAEVEKAFQTVNKPHSTTATAAAASANNAGLCMLVIA